jgi:hypothetical protein
MKQRSKLKVLLGDWVHTPGLAVALVSSRTHAFQKNNKKLFYQGSLSSHFRYTQKIIVNMLMLIEFGKKKITRKNNFSRI